MYNQVILKLTHVEEPLVIKSIHNIDVQLEIGISTLMWNSNKVAEFIEKLT